MLKNLEAYARLMVEVGANVQEGERVVIHCAPEHYAFARLLTQCAYERGAAQVMVDFSDPQISRMNIQNGSLEILQETHQWFYDKAEWAYQNASNFLSVDSPHPDLLKGIDPAKPAAAQMAAAKFLKPLDHYTMNDEVCWTIMALPNADWAHKVFPEIEDDEEALAKLWDLILQVTRMKEEDPVQAWQDHIDRLSQRADRLNAFQFDSLHYRSANGTDLEVGMPKNHIWTAASSHDPKGTTFIPNIPTEEVFSAPHRMRVNGRLMATKPLVYNGTVINDIALRFEDGKCVEWEASTGKEALESIITMDEGSAHLGEIALVPYDSPISNSNTLFYSTLFDENASCHFAFGACYPTCIEGGTDLSEADLLEVGGNSSATHVDFMVGASDLSIIGKTADGQEVEVFKDGNFTF